MKCYWFYFCIYQENPGIKSDKGNFFIILHCFLARSYIELRFWLNKSIRLKKMKWNYTRIKTLFNFENKCIARYKIPIGVQFLIKFSICEQAKILVVLFLKKKIESNFWWNNVFFLLIRMGLFQYTIRIIP